MLFSILYHQFKGIYFSYKSLIYVKKRFPTCFIEKQVELINPKSLFLGDRVSIQMNTILHCGGADWCNNTGEIRIGSQSVISPNCVFWGCGAKIEIGKNFDCAPGVKIFASRTKYENIIGYPDLNPHIFEDVIIGDNVVCFTNVVIGPGVTIGNGAVIGANSVVLKDVQENTLVAGTPAKIIKTITR